MSLIAMAIYSTQENKKDECLEKTLESLRQTVNFRKHRLGVCINSKTERTKYLLIDYSDIISFTFENETNEGTAAAINKVWAQRIKGEHAVKMDDDVVIHNSGWLDDMDKIAENKSIGQIGLKRPDLIESPDNPNPFYRSEMIEVDFGNLVATVEMCHHIMGTCVMHTDQLLEKVGYMWQPKLYGFDDTFMSLRSELAGFKNVFLPWVKIDHIDDGKTPYQVWKQDHASEQWDEYHKVKAEFEQGRDVYFNPFI